MGSTTKAAERKVVVELTELLRKNSDKLLSGETNLCLTTSSLSVLAVNFRRFSENAVEEETPGGHYGKSKKKDEIDLKTWKENIRTLIDFVWKVKALKIIHGSYTMKAPIQIHRFRSLQVLEVKRVPIHMVEGLSKLRGQLKEITVSKSLQTLKDLLEICGGDRTPGLVWPHLKTAYLSFNTLQELDQSLNYIPFIEVIDLSHNNITKTGDCLQSLLDVKRINFGYNMLKSVPQFSSVNKVKVKTLVLRNNNLESLDGIEELVALEELDVSENFLLDHRVLQGLMALKRLQVLCLLGNPLSYKTDHRNLALQHIHPHAGLGIFLLDGKRLTQHEIAVLQENQYRNIYDQETPNVSNGTGTPGTKEPDSNIAVSQLGPHGSKKKRGHRRKRSKGRMPKIANIEDSLEEEYLAKSSGNSPSTSYAEESELDAQRQEDEKYYERMREYYKDDWLNALSANQSDLVKGNQPDTTPEHVPDTLLNGRNEKLKDNGMNEEKTGKAGSLLKGNTDETQQPVVEAVIHPEVHSPVTSPTTPGSRSGEPVLSPTSPEGVKIGETTDIYSLPQSKSGSSTGEKHTRRIFHMYSDDVPDAPTSPKEDDPEQYGAECEPFIMMLPDDEMKQLIVTVNKRFIIEKDLSGNKIAALDLKSLKRIGRTEEKCYGRDIIGGFVFTILRLDFDYVRKDMRQRRYAVESEDEATRFESLSSLHIKSDRVEKDQMQCLKCHHEFEVDSQDLTELIRCPKCASKMVIKSETVKVPAPSEEKTEEKPVETSVEVERRSGNRSNIWHRSTIRRGRKGDDVVKADVFDETDSSVVDSIEIPKKPGLADRYSLGSSLKDYVDQLIPVLLPGVSTNGNTQDPETREEPEATSVSEQANSQSGTEIPALRNNSSWSDVGKSDAYKSCPRGSVSSVESDITVLAGNASRGSIAVISESSSELLKTSATNLQQNTAPMDKSGDTGRVISGNNIVTNNTGVSGTNDGQGQFTPVGSPLTNSVCSSMVSSVYENTLAGSGEDATSREDTEKDASLSLDDIAESVPIRRSRTGKRDRRSKHRNVTIYDQDISAGQFDNNVSVTVEESVNKSSSRETSIYDTSDASEKDSTKFEDAQESSGQSIYDTAVSDDSIETSHDDSAQLLFSRRSHVDSLTNQNASGHSSPLRRKGSSRSRSRSRSRNRSAIYVDDSVVNEAEDKNNSASIPEFPSELSPIKRTNASRRSVKKRSALHIDSKSKISDLENQSIEVSAQSAQNLNETDTVSERSEESSSSVQLPWEQSGNQSLEKSRRDESLNHDEFVNIDHNIKLHLELQVFKAEETAQCAIQCDIVQYMKQEAMKSLLVISTHHIIIFRIEGESSASRDWLKCYEDQPITELRYVDIGLGYQTLRLEFETECSSYTLLIADEGRCKKFKTLISDIVAHSDHSHLEGIGKSNPTTLENLEHQVLVSEDDTVPQQLVRFLIVKYSDSDTATDDTVRRSLVVTQTDLVLVDENHQWPLPRLQAPLTGAIKGRQFTVVQREKINNIGTLSFNEYNPSELQLTFLETSAVDNASTWIIAFETMKGVKSFVDAIRGPWEEEFGVSLDITSTSFTDTETSSLME